MSARITGNRRAIVVAIAVLAALAIVGPIRAWAASSGDDADARAAALLVTRARDAASRHDFTGQAVVRWRVGGATEQATVDVREEGGSLEVVSGRRAAFDDGRHTYLPRSSGWTSVLVQTRAQRLPAPGEHWRLSTRPGWTIAGRPTTQVVVSRRDGTVAQRLFVDDATSLLLGREVVGTDGTVQRSVTYRTFALGPGPRLVVPSRARPDQVKTLAAVPDGYRAPSSPAGYELVTRSRHSDGVLFFYSDGIFSTSVYEQQGDLDWSALPAGGTSATVDGNAARRYAEPSGDVLVWEHGGLVYTVVSDAPTDGVDKMAAALSGPERSGAEAVIDYVLGPFGWG